MNSHIQRVQFKKNQQKAKKSDRVYQVESDRWYTDHRFLAVNEIINDLEQYLVDR